MLLLLYSTLYNWWYLRKQTLLKEPTCIRTYRKSFCFNIFLQKLSCSKRGEVSINILFSQEFGRRWRRQWHPTAALLPGKSYGRRSLVGCSPWVAKSRTWLSDFTFTFRFRALGKEMATHSSVLAWRIPGAGEPGGLPSMGSHRVRHDWSDLGGDNC